MTNMISDDALNAQQSRIMNALQAQAAPSQQQVSPQDLLQALTAQASRQGNYFDMMKQAQATQAQNNVAAQAGIYNQMKEQVARGNSNAAAVDQAITNVAGDDPKLYASIAQDLHNDPETITPANVKSKVMKAAADRGITPLAQQQEQAKTTKLVGEANMSNMFNPQPSQLNALQPGSAPNLTALNNPPSDDLPTAHTTSMLKTQESAVAPAKTTEPDTSGQYNETYLSTLNPALASQIRGIARGDLSMPNGRVLQTPYGQALMQAVMTYDPTASEANLSSRKKTMESFRSGKDADAIAALNTALFHAGNLSKNFADLNNSNIPAYNYVANAVAENTGNTKIQNASARVQSDATALAHELAKVFRSQGMSDAEVRDWQKNMTTTKSPAQLKATVDEAIDLMDGRLYELGQKYNQGMGRTVDPIQLLSPKARVTYQQIRGIAPEAQPATGEQVKIASEPILQNDTPEMAQQRSARGKVIDYREYFR